jgi:hypothetical protein
VRVDEAVSRRSVVPQAAKRSLWLAAAWTGAGAAIVGAVVAIAVVAVCWLPAANGSGNAGSAIRAGVLTFLAALHGGITVDGLPASFVPLGMTMLVAAIAWRAGAGLGDAAAELGAGERAPLLSAAAVQATVFAAVCGTAARFATLGTSRVSVLAAVLAGFVLFSVTGGVAFVRSCTLSDDVRAWVPDWGAPALRAAAAGVLSYLAAGALLVAGSLVLHHQRVETLSHQVGGGWSGVPVLLLGILAAPNAAIAGASYLAGPGFALGTGSGVSLGSTAHGTLPAFPVLGAVPSGPATTAVWLLVGAAPLAGGVCTARAVAAAPTLPRRLRTAGVGACGAALLGLMLAWLGGGAIGSGRLSAFGVSPWQFGLALAAPLAVVAALALTALAAVARWRARCAEDADDAVHAPLTLAAVLTADDDADDPADGDDLDQVS